MPRFVQPFRPNTDIGNSVQNLMTALFYKGGGEQRPASQVALDQAQAEKVMAEAALARQTYGGRAGLGDALDAAMTRYSGARTRPMSLDYAQGPEAGLDLDADTLTRMIRQEPEVYAMGQRPAPDLNTATRVYAGPSLSRADDVWGNEAVPDWGIPQSMPRQQGIRIRDEVPQFPDVRQSYGAPSISSPEDERRLAAEFVAAANLASTSSNPDQIAQALGHFLKQGQERSFLEGNISPTQWFQLGGKPVRGVQDKYDVDLTGERAPSPLGTALAAMDKDAASAEELRSRLPLNAAKEGTERAKQRTESSRQSYLRKRGDAAPKEAKHYNIDPEKIDQEIDADLGLTKEEEALRIGGPLRTEVRVRASQLASEGLDVASAVKQAIDELVDPSVAETDDDAPGLFTGNMKEYRRRAAAPAAKAASSGKPSRSDKTDQQLIDEASAAIKAGAPREAVMKRLNDMGVKLN